MKYYYNFFIMLLFSIMVINGHSQTTIFPINTLLKEQNTLKNKKLSYSHNSIIEVIDSSVLFMRVDPEYGISNKVFWDTMYYFYFETDENYNVIESSNYSLINTYHTGKKELWNLSKYFYDDNNKLIRQTELRESLGSFDTLNFFYYYTDFNELDSITLMVQFNGVKYHVRTDKYIYNVKNRLEKINRYVLDENNNFVLGIVWNYFYNYPELEEYSVEVMNEYYKDEIVNSEKDSIFYNNNSQIDSIYHFYNEGDGWYFGSSEDWFYSESYQIYPDSIRTYDIIDNVKNFDSVQTIYKHTAEVGTDDLDIEYCNCYIPNPYSENQAIKCKDVWNNAEFKNSTVMVYDVLGSLVFKAKANENIRLSGLEENKFHIFTIRSNNGKMLFSKPFISSGN